MYIVPNQYLMLSEKRDMTSFKSRDDVLTLLVHLGYLAYHGDKVFIPNAEVGDEFYRAVKNSAGWHQLQQKDTQT